MALRKKRGTGGGKDKLPIEHNGLYPYMARYLEYLQVKGYSKLTASRRDCSLRRFIEWCDTRDLHDPKTITKPIIERYQRHLFYVRKDDGNPLAFSTQNYMLNDVKIWFKWLAKENYIPWNPASEVETVRQQQRLPRFIMTKEQVKEVLSQPDVSTPEGVRDRAMLEVLYSTGIRRQELCRLELQDAHCQRGILFVREGKGSKDRYVPLSNHAVKWIEKYLSDVRPLLYTSAEFQALFLTDFGAAFTSSLMGNKIKRYLMAAGIEAEGACHLFRHAMATHMLDNGADLRYIQALLGHSDINTTTIYTQVSIEKLKQIHAATHPSGDLPS